MNREREAVVAAGKRLADEGLILRTWGNVSCRSGNRIWITPSGRRYWGLQAADIVAIDLEEASVHGPGLPSSEWRVHRALYLHNPKLGFVIHTHQKEASVWSALGRPLPLRGGLAVPVAAYGFPGSAALEEAVKAAYKGGSGLLLAHHGAIACGADADSAFLFARRMEEEAAAALAPLLDGPALDGAVLLGDDARVPANFPALAAALCRRRGDIAFVLPATGGALTAFSHLRRVLPPYLDDFAQIVGTEMAWAEGDPAEIAGALGENQAVFIPGYGALFVGGDRDDAIAAALVAEKNARAFFAAERLGGTAPLGGREAAALRRFYREVYARRL